MKVLAWNVIEIIGMNIYINLVLVDLKQGFAINVLKGLKGDLKEMRIKTIRSKRIQINIIEFENNRYKSSKGITVYDTTPEEIYKIILKTLKEAEK